MLRRSAVIGAFRSFHCSIISASSCSLSDPLQLCCIFYHGHPCLRNLNSTIPVDVIRVKSYVDSFLDTTSVQVRIAINKLTLSWGETTLSWGETTWRETSFQIVSWACSETAEDGALGTVVSPQSRFPQIKGILSRCSARANLTGFFPRKTMGTVMSCRRDKVTDKRYLDPIRESRSSLDNRKKGQLAQLVRESDLFFRVKRQI